jgi:hypothetical protein
LSWQLTPARQILDPLRAELPLPSVTQSHHTRLHKHGQNDRMDFLPDYFPNYSVTFANTTFSDFTAYPQTLRISIGMSNFEIRSLMSAGIGCIIRIMRFAVVCATTNFGPRSRRVWGD